MIISLGNGYFRLTSRFISSFWALTGGRYDKTAVETYTYTGANDQQWKFVKYTLSLSASKNWVAAGQTLQINPSNKALGISWSSSNTSVATVDGNGKVTGRAPGTATITAKAGGVTATFTVRVLLNATIYQSERLPGKDDTGNIAADMITNDKTRSELYSMNLMLGDLGYTYDQAPSSSTVLPPQGPGVLYDKMRSLSDYFCVSDSSMKAVVNNMIEHFLDGSGTPYKNPVLTQRAVNHESTQRFIGGTKNAFVKYLNIHKGDVNAVLKDTGFKKEMVEVGKPHYDTSGDMTNGLKIAINDTWGYRMDVADYYFDGKNYSGTIRYTIYDHFGLDDGDVTDQNGWYLGYTNEFGSWYVLQHYKGCNNKYKPFVTYIETSIAISGSIS